MVSRSRARSIWFQARPPQPGGVKGVHGHQGDGQPGHVGGDPVTQPAGRSAVVAR
jgi:hypothetical protein